MKKRFVIPTVTLLLGILIGVGGSYLAAGHGASAQQRIAKAKTAGKKDITTMEEVTGIGGIFFKARDPKGMADWYRDHLGVQNKGGFADFLWREHDRPDEVGHTAWALFPKDSDHFGPSSAPFMINYRVGNLDRMLEQLRAAGITVVKVEDSDYGRFAWIDDPEGNRIELWQPGAE